jgi:RNA recognition motif-containing protein
MPTDTIKVSGLSPLATVTDLKNAFEKFGKLKKLTLVLQEDGRSAGQATLVFVKEESVPQAVEFYHGKRVDGQLLTVTAQENLTIVQKKAPPEVMMVEDEEPRESLLAKSSVPERQMIADIEEA